MRQLHGGKPLQVPMLGLKDLAHPAGANLAERHVVAQHASLVTGEKFLRLELVEPLAADEHDRKRLAIFESFFRRQQGRLAFQLVGNTNGEGGVRKELMMRSNGHGTFSSAQGID